MFKRLGYAALIAFGTAAFVVGSTAIGQAKAMKKMAPPPPMAFCMTISKPVCAALHGQTFTYANSCYAAKDGAKIVHQGACYVHHKAMKKHPMKKSAMKKPMKKPMKKK
jgi:hypothetical protein